jgi:hypothetical protein
VLDDKATLAACKVGAGAKLMMLVSASGQVGWPGPAAAVEGPTKP